MNIAESEAYAAKHGGVPIEVSPGIFLLPDGSRLSWGRPMQSTDEGVRLRRQREYRGRFLERAEADARQFEDFLAGKCNPPRWNERLYQHAKFNTVEDALDHLQSIIQRERKALAELDMVTIF